MTSPANSESMYQLRVSHSPFRYVGSKFWLRDVVIPLIPPHEHYIEPFAGGASVFFLQDSVLQCHLNDLDAELINCFEQIRDHVEELLSRLLPLTVTPETHQLLKTAPTPTDDLDRAARYWFINQTSYAGIQVVRTCYWLSRAPIFATHNAWTRKLSRASKRLQDVRFTSEDFETVIDNAPDGAFLFVDPPYRSARHSKFYTHVFSFADHVRLAACLKRHQDRLRFLLTYDDCLQIRDLYGWAPLVQNVDRPHRMNSSRVQIVSGSVPVRLSAGRELLIRNYEGAAGDWAIISRRKSFCTLTDEQWNALAPLLPELPRRHDNRGRPWREQREILNGIMWVLARELPWKSLSLDYPPYQTCHRRYQRWQKDGTWPNVLRTLAEIGGPDLG